MTRLGWTFEQANGPGTFSATCDGTAGVEPRELSHCSPRRNSSPRTEAVPAWKLTRIHDGNAACLRIEKSSGNVDNFLTTNRFLRAAERGMNYGHRVVVTILPNV